MAATAVVSSLRYLAISLSVVAAVGQSPLYEEDLLASAPIRVEQWKQLAAYAASLPEKALPVPKPPASGRDALARSFRESIGYPPPGFLKTPSGRFEKVGEDDVATYYRCYIHVTSQMETYGLYIVPKKAKLPAPLVVSQHGGGGTPEMATFHGGTNYHDQVRGAVAEGYVVFAPLTVMYPFRDRDHGTPIPADVRGILDDQLRARGTTLMGVEAYKISRALDVVLERPEVDPKRVAMIGLSYGGFYTLYTTALEPRIKVAIASCSFRDQEKTGPARTDRIAGRPTDLSSAELVRLIAPRPLQIQNGINDKGFPIDDVRGAVAKSRVWYRGPAAADFDFEAFEGVHEFRGDVAWPFLRKHLAGSH
jgi:dienelactone hydrolase